MNKRPMVDLVNKLLKQTANDQQAMAQAIEDIRLQDKMRLSKDLSQAITKVLEDYTIEYRPKDRHGRVQ